MSFFLSALHNRAKCFLRVFVEDLESIKEEESGYKETRKELISLLSLERIVLFVCLSFKEEKVSIRMYEVANVWSVN